MLGSVDCAMYVENRLGARNANVVNRAETKVRESGTQIRARHRSKPGAGAPTVQIDDKLGAELRKRGYLRRENAIDIRVAGEHRGESVFHHNGNLQIGPV